MNQLLMLLSPMRKMNYEQLIERYSHQPIATSACIDYSMYLLSHDGRHGITNNGKYQALELLRG